jgi:hypothetical protein
VQNPWTRCWKGSFLMRSSVDFDTDGFHGVQWFWDRNDEASWHHQWSQSCMPMVVSCLWGALLPVDLQAVCFIWAILGYKSVSVEGAAAPLRGVGAHLAICVIVCWIWSQVAC